MVADRCHCSCSDHIFSSGFIVRHKGIMKPEDKFTGDMLQDRCRSEVQRYEKNRCLRVYRLDRNPDA